MSHRDNSAQTDDIPLGRRLFRLTIGLVLLIGPTTILMSGVTPPGVAGEVIRNNRAHDIDASPLLYSEVEHMAELEAGARLLGYGNHP